MKFWKKFSIIGDDLSELPSAEAAELRRLIDSRSNWISNVILDCDDKSKKKSIPPAMEEEEEEEEKEEEEDNEGMVKKKYSSCFKRFFFSLYLNKHFLSASLSKREREGGRHKNIEFVYAN